MSKNHRILVIDDNPSIHDDFFKILCRPQLAPLSLEEKEALLFDHAASNPGRMKFEIHSAYQGEEGLQLVEQAAAEGKPYCVAFVDIRMPPGWDGIETVQRIFQIDDQIQIVICSAYSDYSAYEIVQRFGASDRLLLLKKPCDAAEILLATTALSEKWNLANSIALSERQ